MPVVTGHLFEVPARGPSRPGQPVDVDLAAETWRRLVPTMATGRAIRVSRDGRNFPRRGQRAVTPQLPNQPAALLIYDAHGCAPILCLDLDTKRGPVEADLATLTGLLDRTGCRWFTDHSPNGGHHIYVPLATPVPFHAARTVTTALAALAPSLDPQPMTNLLAGCIRPPGARHRTGGHQVLDGPLHVAEDVLRRPTDAGAWDRLVDVLGTRPGPENDATSPRTAPASTAAARTAAPQPSPGSTTRPTHKKNFPDVDEADEADEFERLEALSGYDEPDATFQHTARTGEYDQARYATPSEARQGVVWAAVASGWSFAQLARRLQDGTWPGLASFYARYSHTHHHRALSRDWHRALSFEKRRRRAAGSESVRTRTTSPQQSQRGGLGNGRRVNQEVRVWLTAVEFLHGPDTDFAVRLVLHALGEAAALTGSVVVEHGNRSLAVATGLDHTTVGRVLHKLLDEPKDRALIDLIRPARGVRAHIYQLSVPPLLRGACETRPWRRGKIHALRPAFRELGRPAAFVYAALEQLDDPAGGRDLAALARVGVTATYDALALLSAWGLATRTHHGWVLGTASLAHLAEAWGITDAVRAQIARYRSERAAWHAWLVEHGLLSPTALTTARTRAGPPPSPTNHRSGSPPEPPAPPHETLLELLGRVLGAIPTDDVA